MVSNLDKLKSIPIEKYVLGKNGIFIESVIRNHYLECENPECECKV